MHFNNNSIYKENNWFNHNTKEFLEVPYSTIYVPQYVNITVYNSSTELPLQKMTGFMVH